MQYPPADSTKCSYSQVSLDVVKTLRDFGVCSDENGRLRNEKTGEYVTMNNIGGDPIQFVNAITHHVLIE